MKTAKTATPTETTETPKDYGKRSQRHFNFGDRFGILVRWLMPLTAAASALATCRIQVMGWRKGNHDGDAPRNEVKHPMSGRWVHTTMQTHGANVKNFRKTGPNSRWVHADNFAAANALLACFGGITVDEVIDAAGGIDPDDRMDFDLVDIVESLRPGLLRQTDTHAILTTAAAGNLTA